MKFEIFRKSDENCSIFQVPPKPHPGAQWNPQENRFEIHFTDLRALVNFAEKEGAPIAIIGVESPDENDLPILEIQDDEREDES